MAVIVVCGVSGCGKSTIGAALADKISARFIEGDDHHPSSNVAKMASGNPLTDDDRTAWLQSICEKLSEHANRTQVLACSALTPYVQEYLIREIGKRLIWVNLEISKAEAVARMKKRDHFMPASLIDSQFDAWHPPAGGLSIQADQPIREIVEEIEAYVPAIAADS